MHTLRAMLLLASLASLAACGPRPGNAPTMEAPTLDLGQIVQSTLEAQTAQPTAAPATATLPAPTSAATGGSIAGRLNYPADRIPAMYVVAYRVGTHDYQYIITQAGQSTYTIEDLPPGTYNVIAYTVGGDSFPAGFAGGYTRAVTCGLAPECANHSLIDVSVVAGQTATGVNVLDWYAPLGTFPPFPEQASIATATPATQTGGIAGDLTYPSSMLPALRIVAFQVGSDAYYHMETTPGESHYQLDNLPPGTYHVVAYVILDSGAPSGAAGGYTRMVPCGLQQGCDDHTLIDVVVAAGHVTTDVNPSDFYADAGTFPPDPVP